MPVNLARSGTLKLSLISRLAPDCRTWKCRLRHVFGKAAVEAVPALTESVNEQDSHVRSCAGMALWCIDGQGNVAVPALIDALAAADRELRWSAAAWLGRIAYDGAPEAKSAIPALTKALADDEYFHVRRDAAGALGRIGPAARSAVPALVKALKDESKEVCYYATEALKQIDAAQITEH